jgi:hypothetical protein
LKYKNKVECFVWPNFSKKQLRYIKIKRTANQAGFYNLAAILKTIPVS